MTIQGETFEYNNVGGALIQKLTRETSFPRAFDASEAMLAKNETPIEIAGLLRAANTGRPDPELNEELARRDHSRFWSYLGGRGPVGHCYDRQVEFLNNEVGATNPVETSDKFLTNQVLLHLTEYGKRVAASALKLAGRGLGIIGSIFFVKDIVMFSPINIALDYLVIKAGNKLKKSAKTVDASADNLRAIREVVQMSVKKPEKKNGFVAQV